MATAELSGGCWVCNDMGVPGPHRHTPEICFGNPQSRHFKKDVHDRRMAKMRREGRTLTDRVIALGDPPVGAANTTFLEESEAMLL